MKRLINTDILYGVCANAVSMKGVTLLITRYFYRIFRILKGNDQIKLLVNEFQAMKTGITPGNTVASHQRGIRSIEVPPRFWGRNSCNVKLTYFFETEVKVGPEGLEVNIHSGYMSGIITDAPDIFCRINDLTDKSYCYNYCFCLFVCVLFFRCPHLERKKKTNKRK